MRHPSSVALLVTSVLMTISAGIVAYYLSGVKLRTGRLWLSVVLAVLAMPVLYTIGAFIDVALRDWLWGQLRPEDLGFSPILPAGPYFGVWAAGAIIIGYLLGWMLLIRVGARRKQFENE